MTATIRPVRPEDRAEWQVLWTDYLAFYETRLPEGQFDRLFATLTADDPEIHGLVAELDGKLIGLTHFLFHAHGWKPTGVCYMQDLFLAPDHRGAGIGRALIEAVYAAADKRGVPDVYWQTQSFNITARRLYDKVGRPTHFMVYKRP